MHMHGGEVGVDRAAKCPAQNRVSQKHTRFRRVSWNFVARQQGESTVREVEGTSVWVSPTTDYFLCSP